MQCCTSLDNCTVQDPLPIHFPPFSSAVCCTQSLHHAGGDEFNLSPAKVMLPCSSVLYVAKPSPGVLSLLSLWLLRMPLFQTFIRNKMSHLNTRPLICMRVSKKHDLNLGVSDFGFVQTDCKPSGIGGCKQRSVECETPFQIKLPPIRQTSPLL